MIWKFGLWRRQIIRVFSPFLCTKIWPSLPDSLFNRRRQRNRKRFVLFFFVLFCLNFVCCVGICFASQLLMKVLTRQSETSNIDGYIDTSHVNEIRRKRKVSLLQLEPYWLHFFTRQKYDRHPISSNLCTFNTFPFNFFTALDQHGQYNCQLQQPIGSRRADGELQLRHCFFNRVFNFGGSIFRHIAESRHLWVSYPLVLRLCWFLFYPLGCPGWLSVEHICCGGDNMHVRSVCSLTDWRINILIYIFISSTWLML